VLLAGAAAVIVTTSGDGSAASADAPAAVSTAPTADSTPSDLPTNDTSADDVRSVDARPAGVVGYVFDNDLSVATVDVAPGWTSEIEQSRGREIEVIFTAGPARIDVEVEIEDGVPRERVRTRTVDDRGGEIRDDGVRHLDDDDDRSGDDDDRSGRRGGDDDDRSGHGGDDDHRGDSGRDHPEDD
jgi:hypothetical protein